MTQGVEPWWEVRDFEIRVCVRRLWGDADVFLVVQADRVRHTVMKKEIDHSEVGDGIIHSLLLKD